MGRYKDPVINCRECGRPTRRSRVTAKEFPGTATYGARGMCNPCYESVPKDKHPTVRDEADVFMAHNKTALENYLARRRPHRERLQRRAQAQLRKTA